MTEHADLLSEFSERAKTENSATALMEFMVRRLHESMARYNWVGFYLVDPSDPGVLLVGPYVGSFSPNVRIPLDTGLCGAAATNAETVIG